MKRMLIVGAMALAACGTGSNNGSTPDVAAYDAAVQQVAAVVTTYQGDSAAMTSPDTCATLAADYAARMAPVLERVQTRAHELDGAMCGYGQPGHADAECAVGAMGQMVQEQARTGCALGLTTAREVAAVHAQEMLRMTDHLRMRGTEATQLGGSGGHHGAGMMSHDGAMMGWDDQIPACIGNPPTPGTDCSGTTCTGTCTGTAGEGCTPATQPTTPITLTEQTTAALTQLRSEFKLTHDVYAALASSSGLPLFSNMAASEQLHADAVLALLTRAGIADPEAGKAAGEFSNPDLAALYTQLVAQGSAGNTQAFTVGATLEDRDLAELLKLTPAAAEPEVAVVADNLEASTRNHLRVFVTELKELGVTYAPQYLDAATYASIISSPMDMMGMHR